MRFELRKSEFKDIMNRCIKTGYCAVYYLFSDLDALGYTHGTYGWNADIYGINSLGDDSHGWDAYFVVTGYRPFGGIAPDWEVTEKYERLAQEAIENGQVRLLPSIRMDWLNEILNSERTDD